MPPEGWLNLVLLLLAADEAKLKELRDRFGVTASISGIVDEHDHTLSRHDALPIWRAGRSRYRRQHLPPRVRKEMDGGAHQQYVDLLTSGLTIESSDERDHVGRRIACPKIFSRNPHGLEVRSSFPCGAEARVRIPLGARH